MTVKYVFLERIWEDKFDNLYFLKPLFLSLSNNLFAILRNVVFQNCIWYTVSIHLTQNTWWCVFYDCYSVGCRRMILLFLKYFDVEIFYFVKSITLINNQIHIIHFWAIFEFGYFNRFHQFVEALYLLKSFHQIYLLARIGATFVPIIMPNICWKYSS